MHLFLDGVASFCAVFVKNPVASAAMIGALVAIWALRLWKQFKKSERL